MNNEIEVYGFDNSEDFIETMQTKRFEQLKRKTFKHIENIETAELVDRINEYSNRIKALGHGGTVCKLYDTPHDDTKLIWLDAEFFNTDDTECMTITDSYDNEFKDLFVDLMLDSWDVWDLDGKQIFVEVFGG